MKNIRISLFLKFVVIMILLSVGPLLFVGVRTVNINKKALQDTILELNTQLANSFSEKIDNYLSEINKEIPYITQILSIDKISPETRDVILQTILDSHQNIASISLVNKTGAEKVKVYNPSLEKEPQLINLANNENFKNLLKKDVSRVISKLYFNSGNPRLDLFYKLNENVAILIIVDLRALWDQLKNIHIGKTGYAFLLNEEGAIIAHKDQSLLLKKPDSMPIVSQALHAGTIGSAEYTDSATGIEMIAAYAPIKALKWAVIVQQPKKEAYYSSIIMQRQAIYLIIASILLSAGIAFLIARNLTKPILEVIHAAGKVAQRDFSANINLRTNDELNDLISTFNIMTEELKKYDDMQVDKIVAEKTKTEAIIFSIADGIIMTDYNSKILLINNQARSMLKITEASLEGQKIWDYLPDEEVKKVFMELIQSNEKEKLQFKQIKMTERNAEQFYKLNVKPVTTLKGDDLGTVTVLRDVTIENQLDRMKEDFLHSITHDLRNPMTSIRGFLKFLLDGVGGPLTEQQKKMVETIDRASLRLLGMINDILDLAKLESGNIDLQASATDLYDISQRVLELLKPQFVKKSINMDLVMVDNKQHPVINADGRLLERVITNLVGNAVKFTPENGKITLTIADKTGQVEVDVTDTGEGIPQEYIQKIFDKFQQVKGQGKGGTGLGLTICRYIVEAHKGKIWATSELTKGSTFSFYIPKNLKVDPTGKAV